MKRSAHLHRVALVLLLCVSAPMVHAGTSLDDSVASRDAGETGLELRLADGSVLLVPFTAAGKRSNSLPDRAASEDPSADPRRKATQQRVRVFDPETPGAIASVRG